MEGAPKTLRILCFGDSLTYGTNYGADTHPYATRLDARLRKALPRTEISVTPNGMPGDMVTWTGFPKRLKAACQETHFDWVIILGGTNDLGRARDAEEVFEALRDVWDIALVQPSKVLALTVPECSAHIDWLDTARSDLNALILQWKERNFYTLDIFSKMPHHSLSKEDKIKYWDDGLHFTPAGYDKLGDHVADELLRIIAEEANLPMSSSSSAPAASSSKLSDADVDFEEEAEAKGSKNISQGWVVVRKSDLD